MEASPGRRWGPGSPRRDATRHGRPLSTGASLGWRGSFQAPPAVSAPGAPSRSPAGTRRRAPLDRSAARPCEGPVEPRRRRQQTAHPLPSETSSVSMASSTTGGGRRSGGRRRARAGLPAEGCRAGSVTSRSPLPECDISRRLPERLGGRLSAGSPKRLCDLAVERSGGKVPEGDLNGAMKSRVGVDHRGERCDRDAGMDREREHREHFAAAGPGRSLPDEHTASYPRPA